MQCLALQKVSVAVIGNPNLQPRQSQTIAQRLSMCSQVLKGFLRLPKLDVCKQTPKNKYAEKARVLINLGKPVFKVAFLNPAYLFPMRIFEI